MWATYGGKDSWKDVL